MHAERLVALLFTLQSRRSATVPELAQAMGVSERTLHRDLAALRSAGVPLWSEAGRHGGVRLVEGWRSRLDGLTAREAVAMLTMGVPAALADLGLGTAVTSAHAKLAATMPAELREQAQELAARFHLDAPGWFSPQQDDEQLADLAGAVWSASRVRVTYARDERSVERVLEPLGLVLKAGVWYLVACAGADLRTYRVGRMRSVQVLGEAFERPTGFDLAGWWSRSAAEFERTLQRVQVSLRLSPRGVRALPRILDADLVRDALAGSGPGPDGWTEVVLGLESPEIAAGQLLALGPEVEVVGPAEVRAAYASVVQAMLERHR